MRYFFIQGSTEVSSLTQIPVQLQESLGKGDGYYNKEVNGSPTSGPRLLTQPVPQISGGLGLRPYKALGRPLIVIINATRGWTGQLCDLDT